VHRPAGGAAVKIGLEDRSDAKGDNMSRSVQSKVKPAGVGLVALLGGAMVAALGCGDNRDTTTPDASGDSSPACVSDTGPIDPTTLIDDFEHSGANLPFIAGRMGSWYASGDATSGALLDPSGLAAPEPIPGGRCDSHKAMHLTGSGFLDWGSQITVTMHYGPNDAGISGELPYDAAARGYQGVSFFARVGDTSTTTVRFAVSDEYARPEAGLCTVGGAQGNTCYDTYGVMLSETLTTDWRQFRIPWTGLSQQNFGLPGGATPDTTKIYDLGFTFPARVIFDLWVDDITFY
jgi:hypothetical protein